MAEEEDGRGLSQSHAVGHTTAFPRSRCTFTGALGGKRRAWGSGGDAVHQGP